MHEIFCAKCLPLHMGMDSIKVFKNLDPHTIYIYDPKPTTVSSRNIQHSPLLKDRHYVQKQT
jgi:hypothetical protein